MLGKFGWQKIIIRENTITVFKYLKNCKNYSVVQQSVKDKGGLPLSGYFQMGTEQHLSKMVSILTKELDFMTIKLTSTSFIL